MTDNRKSITIQAAADLLDVPYGVIKDACLFGLLDSFLSGETRSYRRVYIDSIRAIQENGGRSDFLAAVDQKRLERHKSRKKKGGAKTESGPKTVETSADDLNDRLTKIENAVIDSINVVLKQTLNANDRLRDLELEQIQRHAQILHHLENIAGAQNQLHFSQGMKRHADQLVPPIKSSKPWANGPDKEGEGSVTDMALRFTSDEHSG